MTDAPPRLSVTGDGGIPVAPFAIRGRIRVFVDGDLYRCIVAYDVPAGWVEIIEHDERGMLVHRDGEFATRRVTGNVRAILLPEGGKSP